MKSLIMPSLVLGAACMLAGTVFADAMKENPMLEIRQLQSAARKASLGTNGAADPDTVWVGHIIGTHSVPWSANPAWTGWGPFHVGRAGNGTTTGGYRVSTWPTSPVNIENNGYWDFDRFNGGETDTLQGWNSVPHPYSSISGNVSGDRATRWFFCMDWGNSGNHKGNSFGKKTYGVISYWHVDGGNTQPAGAYADGVSRIANTTPIKPTWAPIAGAGSAWCGLRAHGDISGTADAVTGNYHNSTLVQNYGDNHFRQVDQQNPSGFADSNYPGYGSQWDQIMYRDFTADGSGNVTVSFDYRTGLSTSKARDANNNEYGYYLGDPLKVPTLNDGNFISGTDFSVPATSPSIGPLTRSWCTSARPSTTRRGSAPFLALVRCRCTTRSAAGSRKSSTFTRTTSVCSRPSASWVRLRTRALWLPAASALVRRCVWRSASRPTVDSTMKTPISAASARARWARFSSTTWS
jgi:hypothetical protein